MNVHMLFKEASLNRILLELPFTCQGSKASYMASMRGFADFHSTLMSPNQSGFPALASNLVCDVDALYATLGLRLRHRRLVFNARACRRLCTVLVLIESQPSTYYDLTYQARMEMEVHIDHRYNLPRTSPTTEHTSANQRYGSLPHSTALAVEY